MPKQANADGTIVDGTDEHLPSGQRDTVVRQALQSRGWTVTNFTVVPQGGHFSKISATVTRGSVTHELEIYVFLSLSWRNRSEYEKGIQLTRPYSEHASDFMIDNTGHRKCLLLSIYKRGSDIAFCAWPASSFLDHASPTTCYVSVNALADAMRSGFGQYEDATGRLVCCFLPDFFYYYVENVTVLHKRVAVQQVTCSPIPPSQLGTAQAPPPYAVPNVVPPDIPRNRIVYGAPGTGKSYMLNEQVDKHFPDAWLRKRITFYPDYSYSLFVGSYRPAPIYRVSPNNLYEADRVTGITDKMEPLIDYQFAPGPLLDLYCRAKLHPNQQFVLVIEELNRADAAAVFGDWFQLLDRDDKGVSQFAVAPPKDAAQYIRARGILDTDIRLPSNLYIWSTMNSADQGVMPLDAAFKRRWVFEYVGLERFCSAADLWKITLKFQKGPISWNEFRSSVNERLKRLGVPEDRLLGPFFLRETELSDAEVFKNKLLLYLRDDVVRHEPEQLFMAETFGDIVEKYDKGENVFRDLTFQEK